MGLLCVSKLFPAFFFFLGGGAGNGEWGGVGWVGKYSIILLPFYFRITRL